MVKLYHTPEAAQLAGITIRQMDHWTRIGIAHPIIPATGSGSRIGWSREDIAKLATIGRLARILGGKSELPSGVWSLLDEPGDVLVVADTGIVVAAREEIPALAAEFPALIIVNRVTPIL